jgi:hypothetical protein
MVTEVAICGDSFACGSGIDTKYCFERSFGALVADSLDASYKIYARSGCCNYIIYLQVQKVIEDYKHKDKPLVLISTTNHSRFTFPSDHVTKSYNNYTLEDVEYDLHEPYCDREGWHRRDIPFKPSKTPKLISETISNFLHFASGDGPNLAYLFKDVDTKFAAIKTFYEELYDDSIKQTNDTGLILMMHVMLKEAGFPHVIMSPDQHQNRFIGKENFLQNDWGVYSRKYPDKGNSGHCDERGHVEVAEKIIHHIERIVS